MTTYILTSNKYGEFVSVFDGTRRLVRYSYVPKLGGYFKTIFDALQSSVVADIDGHIQREFESAKVAALAQLAEREAEVAAGAEVTA